MELRHLRYFCAVAKELNIGRAAATLNISQPPLTRQIQQLEDDLGAQLFKRSVKGMELTDAGRTFYAEAKNILALVELASERARRAAQGLIGRLDVGIFGSGMFDVVPRVLLRFRQSFPDVNIVLHTLDKLEQVEALRERRITIGFNRVVPKYPGVASQVVMWERLMVGLHESNPLAGRKALALRELADQSFVLFPSVARPNFSDFIVNQCQKHGFTPRVEQIVGDAVTGVALVASGFGTCIVPESVLAFQASGVVFLPLEESPPLMLDVSCLYREYDDSVILRELLQIIAEFREGSATK
ncbi:LysR family transcriptional regulator [Rhodoblastus acidophilus]|uniref:LysR family transcriptional regulator n=1 Tax=Candidatus Rhodoblastus alkanivorans TaxID=2954117 RepID=A0ABS9Z3W0_9HYPH|nr:LysR family transcriptional regulator [Candidatus Rhodoblastus alkanivorans]MCI4679976.1 LysR family transcriptional regulator [Candidatus Rhodoblastus alkanivorans]MCI4682359.1 LysR family transcriptional regulator [Candidatus Rhodoblastus alkanivorans]MDI4639662.1 LysR family transcriptional regulator [Rhodoblastus acidophilus]